MRIAYYYSLFDNYRLILYYKLILPMTTGCFAPVTDGTLFAWAKMASFASMANASASFALPSKPSYSFVITLHAGSSCRMCCMSAAFSAPPPPTMSRAGGSGA